MRTRLEKYSALSLPEQGLFWSIWLRLGALRLALKLRSLQSLTPGLAHSAAPGELVAVEAVQLEEAKRIGYLVAAAAAATPWRSSCLVQVLLCQRLLARCSIPGRFFLGVSGARNRSADLPFAHAWVEVGGEIVNGGEPGEFAIISCYAWR